jgi:hypothetical protein
MTKKYGVTIKEMPDGTFSARFVRSRTSRGTRIQKEQGGFLDEATAQAWGESAIETYRSARREASQRRAARRKTHRELEEQLSRLTYQELAQRIIGKTGDAEMAKNILEYRAETLWQEVIWRALKRGESEYDGTKIANQVVGQNWRERLNNALEGRLDHVDDAVKTMATANAQWLLRAAR